MLAPTPPDKIVSAGRSDGEALFLVGRRRLLPRLKGHGGKLWRRWRYPHTRRTPLLIETSYNPKTLAAEQKILDKRPLYWTVSLALLLIAPPLLGDNSFLSAATVFAIYAAINVVWMLIIGTAGIFSLATLAVVGAAAYATSYLSINFGLPWWGMIAVGPLFGLVFGVIIAVPAIRLEGFYYALLTVGIAELCRDWVVQSRSLGAATYGLYGADSYLPAGISERGGLVLSFYAACLVMLAALALYRLIDGRRLGLLLRAAPERQEAFAEALGINYRSARIQVFLISSAALGAIGGFYASYFKGASPSLFTMDSLLLLLAMIVIGGIGSAEGAVAGTLVVVLFDRVFIGLGPVRLMIIAAIMFGTVLFLRRGLFGIVPQFRAWREKKKSERRALRTGKGGEVMPEEATEISDKQVIYVRRFEKQLRDELKRLITDELIAEHGRSHGGRRSDALERVLAYFRRAAVADKYAIVVTKPFAEYRIVALSGRRGVPPRLVDDRVYATAEAAAHGVFLKRVQDLLES
ncbi:MAG TPA: branched-chain amino acid ABC transporter permease [Stellaceae bacterium]|nr:branched-chain amino acid ABC transporter permease [Stellaceae bacterium]